MKEIYIFGKGGHAKVVIDIIEKLEGHIVKGILDRDSSEGESFLGYPVYSESAFDKLDIKNAVVGIGSGKIRKGIMENRKDLTFCSLIHPAAQIGRDVVIEDGVVVMAGAVVNPCSVLKKGCLVNTSASIDHDCFIGEYSSISPGATLGGAVKIGQLASVGIGSSVIQLIEVGDEAVVGAGSVVLKNIPDKVKAFGVPCKIVEG